MFECKECKNREPGCHSRCESYLKEKERLEKIREAKNKDRDFIDYRYSMVVKAKAAKAIRSKKRLGISKLGG